jgi:putative transcriptional regulator
MPDNPTPAQVLAARTASGRTQRAAAALIYRTERNWQQWESGERRMDPALFELFALKAR